MYKLAITTDEDQDFYLIAIYTILEDYKLAFLINKILPFNLSKSIVPAFIKNKNQYKFEYFKFENEDDEIFWYLINNQIITNKKNTVQSFNLFENEIDEIEYFLPELKKADYFFKISDQNIDISELLKKLNQIHNISTASLVDLNKIKTKKHLIF